MEVLVKNHLGQTLAVHKKTASSFRRYRRFDWLGLSLIERALSRMHSPVALDVGANLGNHALVMAHYCRVVHAFEPLPATCERLRQNVARNNLANVVIHPLALGEREETAHLFVGRDANAGSTSLVGAGRAQAESVAVPVRVGDQVLEAAGVARVDLIKIDVEGFEAHAVLGLRRTIARDQPLIFMEWNNATTRDEFAARGIFGDLFAGWTCLAIRDSYARSRFPDTLGGRIARLRAKLFTRREPVLEEFDPAGSYNNVVLFPPQAARSVLSPSPRP